MNFKEFIELADKKTSLMDKEELQIFIHSIARKVYEGNREEFIKFLEEARIGDQADGQLAAGKIEEQEIEDEFNRLKGLLDQVEEGELYLQAEGYEDNSSGYWNGDLMWDYEDPHGVHQVYEDGCALLRHCVNYGFYRKAMELFDLMMDTEVTVENNWDVFSLGIEEMVEEEILSIDLEELALHVLYATYHVTAPEKRAKELYQYFSISFFRNVRLEGMLGLGREELDRISEFWEDWISLLTDTSGDVAGRLLKEAVRYQSEENDAMLNVARRAYQSHPSLYMDVMKSLEAARDNQRLMEVGLEALGKVGKDYVIRSEIALKAAEAAIRLGEEACAENCRLEAFRSCTTPVNYFRIMNENGDPEKYKGPAQEIILSVRRSDMPGYAMSKELMENQISGNTVGILRFLSGSFDYAAEQCRKVDGSLGWSGTFVKCGLDLFLLLLLKEKHLQQGCSRVADDLIGYMRFEGYRYFQGTKYKEEHQERGVALPREKDLFWKCFSHWKSLYALSEDQVAEYLSILEKRIDGRVRAIVAGQHRKEYENAAMLVAALGEVKESLGEKFAKEKILQKYREEFPRHSSFHGALRANGMRDSRKGKRKNLEDIKLDDFGQ
ncbi:MAG: hypothetical protein HFG60_13610 [Lachnospiraceae bacterium]|nr:hypothetical protein [Lachnospiraceae bacterium]